MKRMIFVKPVWLFLSGDEATVPDRVARWLSGSGFAYPARQPEEPAVISEQTPEPVAEIPPPLQPAPPEKPLIKRSSKGKKK